ncbi:MAG: hypothetical protein EA411_11780 [Saprospirales bacterium]|nr:MAG: hypothetical protein EA411_11780 [Saprospirales bacterium]
MIRMELLKYYFTLLPALLLFAGLKAQPPILLDEENAIHVIEFEEFKDVNHHGPSFSLVEYGEKLLWVSYDKNTSTSVPYVMGNQDRFFLLYSHPDKLAEEPTRLKLSKEEKQAVAGPASYCEESGWLFFTANQKRRWQGRSQLGLFLIRGEGEKPEQLPFVHPRYNFLHPAWDADNNRLYFSSDYEDPGKPMSLYYSDKTEGGWTSPLPLSDRINSKSNEVFPHIVPEGLFFSSDRPGGIGGLDIYFAAFENGQLSNPMRLPAPFNSSGDDFGIHFNSEGTRGFLSSDRDENGKMDRNYQFDCGLSCFLPATVIKSLELRIIAAGDGRDLRDVEVKLIPEKVLLGQFSGHNIKFDPLQNNLSLNLSDMDPDRAGVVRCSTDREGRCLMESRTNETNFFVFASKKGAQSVLQNLEFDTGFDHKVIEIEMDRDCRPTSISLVCPEDKEIIDPRLWIENMRTGDVDTLWAEENIYTKCMNLNGQYRVFAMAEDRHPAREAVYVQNTSPEDIRLRIEPKEVEVVREGTVLELQNIYYEYNSHLIGEGAASELDELASIMKRDTVMVVELRAHTDSRGSELYNLQLSQRRANSAMEYLVTAGIEPHRIRTVGFGETQLRNHCREGVQCTEEEHAYNRRTEVAVIEAGEGVRAVREEDGYLRFTIYE